MRSMAITKLPPAISDKFTSWRATMWLISKDMQPSQQTDHAIPVGHPSIWGTFVQPWQAGVLLTTLVLAVPLLTVMSVAFFPASDVWQHLQDTVLKDYVLNSLGLAAGVSLGTLVLGVSTAWVTSVYEFPGRRCFAWALLLPMAIPAYIIAYTYTGMFDFAGPVQTWLRNRLGWSYGEYWFPEIRSLGGAITMLSLVLYPYVYMLARAAFLNQSVCVLEVSRTLGCGPWQSFFQVALPLARPAVVAGVALAVMETLADYGTVKYFGISTLTTGIFRTWFGLGDHIAATRLATLLMGFIFMLLALEHRSRRQARYHHTSTRYKSLPHHHLRGLPASLAFVTCFLPLFAGFLLPCSQLLLWGIRTAHMMVDTSFVVLTVNSLMLASSAAIISLMVALFLAYGRRLRGTYLVNSAVRFAAMGYAIPGTVLAVGVVIPFAWLDNSIDAWLREYLGISSGLLLSGTLFALLFAYTVRFLALALQTIEAGLGNIRPSMDESARSLGRGPMEVLVRVHIPVMRGSLLTALLLVFVDVLKELPATLVLRPFNFNTLAVRAFELASDERLADSSTAALAIVLVGIVPVILLSRSITSSRPGHGNMA